MNTETISYLKKNAANLNLKEPLVITQHGIPTYVVEKVEDRNRRDEAIALLKMLAFANKDIMDGNTSAVSSLKNKLAKRKSALQGTKSGT